MTRLRCAGLDAEEMCEPAVMEIDVHLNTKMTILRAVLERRMAAADTSGRVFAPHEFWRVYVAKQDDETWLDDKTMCTLTYSSLLQSERKTVDPTASLDDDDCFGPAFTLPADHVHLIVLITPQRREEVIRLKCGILEETVGGKTSFLMVKTSRSDTVGQLKYAIETKYWRGTPQGDLLWGLYVARNSDGSWPRSDAVWKTTSRELVESGRQLMDFSARLESDGCFGQDFRLPEQCVHVLAISTTKRKELTDWQAVRCAVLDGEAPVELICVDVRRTNSCKDLICALKRKLGKLQNDSVWRLAVARRRNGSWIEPWNVDVITSCSLVYRGFRTLVDPAALLASDACFGPDFSLPDHCVHVLMSRQMSESNLKAILDTATWISDLPEDLGQANADKWCDTDCGSTKSIGSIIHTAFPLLPMEFYIRKEILVVWRLFKEHFQSRFEPVEEGTSSSSANVETDTKQLVLVGSPGVGKSCLLLLMCVYVAVKLGRRVVLYQRRYGYANSVYFLAGDRGKVYAWEDDPLDGGWGEAQALMRVNELADYARRSESQEREQVWVYTDGLAQHEMETMLRGLHLDVAVLPFPYYDVLYSSVDKVWKCLVAYWLEADNRAVGKLRGWSGADCNDRYRVSGGSLQWFLQDDLNKSRQIIQRAVDRIVATGERGRGPRQCQSAADGIFMMTLPADAPADDYILEISWKRKVTSAFAQSLLPEKCTYPGALPM